MKINDLPEKTFSLPQSSFKIIPGSPWVYSINKSILEIFEIYQPLSESADIVLGMKTSDNFRFVRNWWEINKNNNNWLEYEKHVTGYPYYYPTHALVLWNPGSISYYDNYYSAQLPNKKYWKRAGINFSSISSTRFTAKLLSDGKMCDMAANTIFLNDNDLSKFLCLLGILNSSLCQYFLLLLNPTINIQVIDVKRLPFPDYLSDNLVNLVLKVIRLKIRWVQFVEETYDYKIPSDRNRKIDSIITQRNAINQTIQEIDDEVYKIYEVNKEDRKSIENEIHGISKENQNDSDENEINVEDTENDLISTSKSNLSNEWLCYSLGICLSRFKPGMDNSLGSAIHKKSDFAISSLPEPAEEEFNELVGAPSEFAYIDKEGGRHVFSQEIEQALQDLALTDGIAVFDENHPRDLPTLVRKALVLMLGEAEAQEVIRQAAGGDLRQFLEKDFFTKNHIKQYNKRPVYWPIQSAKRSYGFVLFHEKIDQNTFYTLQQPPYLATKQRAVQLRLEDLSKKLLTVQGSARKSIEKEIDELQQLLEELTQFAKDLEAITKDGYEPKDNWIDDGVILRMAPLWKVIPSWSKEPKKYWERLKKGDYDWSHIAMHYWPERVKKACQKNKSYAIAHGHEEWYTGG